MIYSFVEEISYEYDNFQKINGESKQSEGVMEWCQTTWVRSWKRRNSFNVFFEFFEKMSSPPPPPPSKTFEDEKSSKSNISSLTHSSSSNQDFHSVRINKQSTFRVRTRYANLSVIGSYVYNSYSYLFNTLDIHAVHIVALLLSLLTY